MKPEAEALLCAEASLAIYGLGREEDCDHYCKGTMAAFGFARKYVWYELSTGFQNFRAFTAESDEYNLIAFRGTKIPPDWVTDLMALAQRFDVVFPTGPAAGEIHSGFGYCLKEGIDEIIDSLSKGYDRNKPLLITGHSLGGALAALAGAYFTLLKSPVPPIAAIYTFGQPRIGFQAFCDSFDKNLSGKLIRFVNNKDIVPRVPLRKWSYCDQERLIHFASSGVAMLDSLEWKNDAATAFENLLQVAACFSRLGDHSMEGYRDLVKRNQKVIAYLLQINKGGANTR